MKLILVTYLFSFSFLSSNEDIEQFFDAFNKSDYELSNQILEKLKNKKLQDQLVVFAKLLKGDTTSDKFIRQEISDSTSIAFNMQLINIGLSEYINNGNEIKAFNTLKRALILSKKRKDKILLVESLKLILELYQRFGSLIEDNSYNYFLKEYENYAYNNYERNNSSLKRFELDLKFDSIIHKGDIANISKLKLDSFPLLVSRKNIALSAYYRYRERNIDTSHFFIEKAIQVLEKETGLFQNERLIASKINLAIVLNEKRNFNEAIKILNDLNYDKDIYLFQLLESYDLYWKSIINDSLGNKVESLMSYNKYLEKELLNDQSRKLQIVSEYETKYQTAEKEKQILEEQQKTRTTRNWLIVAGLVLLLGTGIAILLQKNTTKKRQLAEQQALLKQERVDNLLKEQELVSIDAMIEGQEKERQRVANELHDDLGSLMATIKLHFDNSKVSKKDPALKNAQKLLEEAYQKVRGMAHSKNSGVMSDQGLLPAIKKMAKVITETNALEVKVEDFGMGDRLENSLELNLFRMVQELVANAIKHAEATQVNIQLTQHDDNLNIIIEDNGKGFDRSKVDTTKTGMGLTTIEKRIEHLEGNFTVDSVLGKGTSILIDIPV